MNKLQVTKVTDHEGEGRCGQCGREGLRWVVSLSDGSAVGTECAKAVLGWKPATRDYAWTRDFRPVAEHAEYGDSYVLWQHVTGTQTRTTTNGRLTSVGGQRDYWKTQGWLTPANG